jgi:hypothetical protein
MTLLLVARFVLLTGVVVLVVGHVWLMVTGRS